MKKTIRFDIDAEPLTSANMALTLPKAAGAKISSDCKTASASGNTKVHSQVRVEGIFNGIPFRSVIESNGEKGCALIIDANMKKFAKVSENETAVVELTSIGDESETRIPPDLAKALADAPKAKSTWDDITPIARRDWIFWIISGKLAKTRAIRIGKACDMLASGKRRVCCFAGINWLMQGK